MIERISKTIKWAVLVLLLACGTFAQTAVNAPSLELRDLKGHPFRLTDYKGKVVLINFWATWCPPCRTEIPELVRWQRDYRNSGLQVIGITYPPQRRAEVARFIRNAKVNYPVALGIKQTKRLFTASETLPMTIVVDAEGNVREMIEGVVFPEEFEQKIKPLLPQQIIGPVSGPKNRLAVKKPQVSRRE